MEKYYYNYETDNIESVETIRRDYFEEFGSDYDSFEDYLQACQTYNNGVLVPVSVRLDSVKRMLAEKMELARKYGYDEYAEELADLLAQMDTLRKYNRGGR